MSIIREERIGDCVLYQGDCLEIMPLLGKVDAVCTDPPYGIGFASQPTKWQRLAGQKPKAWDDVASANLPEFLNVAPIVAVWGGNYYEFPASRGWLSWFKPDAPPSMGSLELCWTNQDQNTRQISCSISSTNPERVGHPTQKPLAVMLWTLQRLPPAQTILDPFAGSGTTGVACVNMGRSFIGIEQDPEYFDIMCRRIDEAHRQADLFVEKPVAKPPVQKGFDI